jgi:hypothetical protein
MLPEPDWHVCQRMVCLTCTEDLSERDEPIAVNHLHHLIVITNVFVWSPKSRCERDH